jgi:hypothetical protein
MTSEVPDMLRCGAGFFSTAFVALSARNWYWRQTWRLATTRETERVDLLVAHLAVKVRASS